MRRFHLLQGLFVADGLSSSPVVFVVFVGWVIIVHMMLRHAQCCLVWVGWGQVVRFVVLRLKVSDSQFGFQGPKTNNNI